MSILSDAKTYYNYLRQISNSNNLASAQQADKQMAFQKEMSDTAHQREVADLKAAGLNPVLSANGQGASTPSGAMGQTDFSATSAMASLMSQMISSQAAIQVAGINAGAAKYAADRAYEANQNFPNSWAGLASRLIDDLGLRGSLRGSNLGQDLMDSIGRAIGRYLGVSPSSSGIGSNQGEIVNHLNSMMQNATLWSRFKSWLNSQLLNYARSIPNGPTW